MRGPTPDVIIVGAGIVGGACAHVLTGAGLRVAVVERGSIAGGTTSGGEGNILVSDKEPGPELELALLSARLWRGLADDLGASALEYEPKGGVVVARAADTVAALAGFAAHQREAGVEVDDVDAAGLFELEPNLARDVAGGAWYPQDAQVQPMLATASLLRRARSAGAVLHAGGDRHRDPPGPGWRGHRRAHGRRDDPRAPRAVGHQRRGDVGRRGGGARRDAAPRPPASRVHPGDGAAAAGRPPQGLHG